MKPKPSLLSYTSVQKQISIIIISKYESFFNASVVILEVYIAYFLIKEGIFCGKIIYVLNYVRIIWKVSFLNLNS